MELTTVVEITKAQRQQFQQQGYFITDVVFDESTLQPMRDEFNRLWQEIIEAARQQDALTQELAQYRPFMSRLHEKSETCAAFCRHTVFQELCRQLIGPDADLSYNQAILKPPAPSVARENSFAWHQDMWYATHNEYSKDTNPEILLSGNSGFTCWVAITRTIVDNGTLWVLPGRHQEGLLPHVKSEEKREFQGQFDTSWKIPVVMQAGQILIFNKYLPHSSGANVSQETRMAYQIAYSLPGLKLAPSPDIVPLLRDGIAQI
jgi:ectoine hydroxylase-related dioxygenase (phytanoyl-CoA dioxygenase family)